MPGGLSDAIGSCGVRDRFGSKAHKGDCMTIWVLYCAYVDGVDVIGRYLHREHAEAERYLLITGEGYLERDLWIDEERED
jgi:glycerate kinase